MTRLSVSNLVSNRQSAEWKHPCDSDSKKAQTHLFLQFEGNNPQEVRATKSNDYWIVLSCLREAFFVAYSPSEAAIP